MGNYFLFLGGPIIVLLVIFPVISLWDEACRRVGETGKNVISGPLLLGVIVTVILAAYWQLNMVAVVPSLLGFSWLILASAYVVKTKKDKKYRSLI
jgi:hypothetical protein